MKALIMVDVQNDFVTGSLAVPRAKEIIPIIYWMVERIAYDNIVETADCHPNEHISFKTWPIHCVRDSIGALSALTELKHHNISKILDTVPKGMDINHDSYSGFFDNDYIHGTILEPQLRLNQISEVDIVGLATDYCVKHTALDAVKLGYKTNVLLFACRGVEEKTTLAAIEEMRQAGVVLV